MNSRPKISRKQSGTTSARRAWAGLQVLELAAPDQPGAGRQLDPASTFRRASSTNAPRSAPRTLAWTTTRRLPFSRLIWFSPSE